ncbi:MAG: NUDIX domain-containing protein [Candidatus Shapirobacteria bacterium]|jgi:8-oxo-dGTP diphosphatase
MQKDQKQIVVLTGYVEKDDKILMLQRWEPENKGAHLRWQIPGGCISFNEKPEKTIVREILEETGYKVKPIDLAPIVQTYTWEYEKFTQHTIILCYVCKFINGKLDTSDSQTNAIKWFKYSEIPWSRTLVKAKQLIDAARRGRIV